MKKLFTIFLLTIVLSKMAYSTRRLVDPNVIPNTVPNVYATFQAAWYSTINGDTLLIKPGNYNIGTITIDRGVTIQPDTVNGAVTLTGNINVGILNGNSPLNVIGIYLNGAFNGNTRSNLLFIGVKCNSIMLFGFEKNNFIDCVISGNFECYNGECGIFRCTISGDTKLHYVKMIASKTNNLILNSLFGQQNDTVNRNLIIADTIQGYLDYRCEDRVCVIANNLINELDISAWNSTVNKENQIWNNEFYNEAKLAFPFRFTPKYNLDISNNLSIGKMPIGVDNNCASYYSLSDFISYNYFFHNIWASCHVAWSSNISLSPGPNTNVPGVFKWTYNGTALGNSQGSGAFPFTNIAGTTDIIDAGNPDPKYMDIDMTVNDRGRLGGPYSILNYSPTVNPSNGKAYIYDIEIPDVISSPNQPIQIKAQGYHRN